MCEKTNRLRILQILAGMFEHAVSDKVMKESLEQYGVNLSKKDICKEYEYLTALDIDGGAPPIIVNKIEEHNMWTARITAVGIDLVFGASSTPGVRPANPAIENLAFKKDIRRGILSHLNERRGKFVDDFDISEAFVRDSYIHVTTSDMQFHIWYLADKNYVEIFESHITANTDVRARITPDGINLVEENATDIGVTTNGKKS